MFTPRMPHFNNEQPLGHPLSKILAGNLVLNQEFSIDYLKTTNNVDQAIAGALLELSNNPDLRKVWTENFDNRQRLISNLITLATDEIFYNQNTWKLIKKFSDQEDLTQDIVNAITERDEYQELYNYLIVS